MMSKVIPTFGKNKKKSNRQKAWDFMRRNRAFRVGDILMVTGISESSLKVLVRELSKAEYIAKSRSVRKFRDKEFRLIRNTGVVCPSVLTEKSSVLGRKSSVSSKFLYDSNISKKVFIGKKSA